MTHLETANGAAPRPSGPAISPLHAMLAKIERRFDAEWVNAVANDPSVYDQVRGMHQGPLDFTEPVADPRNLCLTGEHGAFFLHQRQPGLYETHLMVLPSGRGRWAETFGRACVHAGFVATDAIEFMSRCPRGNIAARAITRRGGGIFEFSSERGWPGGCDVYSLTLQEWARRSDALMARGAWFYRRLRAEFAGQGKTLEGENDVGSLRAAGLAYEMLLGGQYGKAVIFSERTAAFGANTPLLITSLDPLTVNFLDALLIIRPERGDFWVPSSLSEMVSHAIH